MNAIDISIKNPPENAPGMKKSVKNFLFYLVQWTWGLPVNIVGGIMFLICKALGRRHQRFGYSFITYIPWNAGGVSLGLFIFMKDQHKSETWTYNTRIHEYGHTWQCLLLGPLYFIVVAIPSAFWCNVLDKARKKNNWSYYKLYCEHWANLWGQKGSHLPLSLSGIDEKYC